VEKGICGGLIQPRQTQTLEKTSLVQGDETRVPELRHVLNPVRVDYPFRELLCVNLIDLLYAICWYSSDSFGSSVVKRQSSRAVRLWTSSRGAEYCRALHVSVIPANRIGLAPTANATEGIDEEIARIFLIPTRHLVWQAASALLHALEGARKLI